MNLFSSFKSSNESWTSLFDAQIDCYVLTLENYIWRTNSRFKQILFM